jgi:futalosine hydrolase
MGNFSLSMRILLVAATEAEIAPTLDALRAKQGTAGNLYTVGSCITGVGMLAIAYELTRALVKGNWDFVIGAGIAGAFSKSLGLADCVVIESEQVADFGAEDGDTFLDAFSMGLVKANHSPYTHRLMNNPLSNPPFAISHLPRVSGLTVTTVSGNETTIAHRRAHYSASVESMEGAALHYVCLKENIPFLQLRAISNYVTRRDKSTWRMADAIASLNTQLIAWLLPVS